MSGPFDRQHPTPVPPPPRDPGESGAWWQAHRELGERLGGRLEALEERVGEVRDGDIVAHGLDGKNGKLGEAIKDIAAHGEQRDKDSTRNRWILGILASFLIAGGGFIGGVWQRLGDRATTLDVRVGAHDVQLDVLKEQVRHQAALLEALVQSRSSP